VASGAAANSDRVVAAPPGSAKSAALALGGNPTGRETKFRFPAGTPDGDRERRDAEAERKRGVRAVARQLVAPPPLPSAGAAIPGQTAAPLGVTSAGLPGPPLEPFVPWTGEDVRDFTDELVELSEAKRVSEFCEAAKEAKLPASLIKDIQRDAHYPAKCKAHFKTSLAGVVAKWLNKTGISAKNREEAAFLFYGATILLHGRRMRAHLDAIIDEDRAEREKSEKAKEPAPAATSILPLVATPAKARAA